MTPKQRIFFAELAKGTNQTQAYKIAYGKDNPGQASKMAQSFRPPEAFPKASSHPGLTEIGLARVQAAKELAKELGEFHPLELKHNRILELARIADGSAHIEDVAVTKEGEVIRFERSANFREIHAALVELNKVHGDHVTKIEVERSESTHMFVTIDNGRGPLPPGVTPKALPAGAEDYEICPHCKEAIESESFARHEKSCPEGLAEG